MGRQTKVYGLKHATGLMKIQHMHMVMDWKNELKEHQAAYALEQLRKHQTELMTELISLDLAWEAWFDDDANVPTFGTIAERVKLLERRVAELKTPQPLELRRETLPVSTLAGVDSNSSLIVGCRLETAANQGGK